MKKEAFFVLLGVATGAGLTASLETVVGEAQASKPIEAERTVAFGSIDRVLVRLSVKTVILQFFR